MNKLVFALLGVSIFFVSCNSFVEHDVEIENKSSETVHFTVDNYPDIEKQTLQNGESVTLDLYDHPRLSFNDYERVYFETGNSSVSIYDLEKYEYRIVNTSEKDDAEIIEENNMMGTSESEAVVTVTKDTPATVYVYTKKPSFKKRNIDSTNPTKSDGTANYQYTNVPDFITISVVK